MCRWIPLFRALKTGQACEVICLLRENRVRVRTVPREFGGPIGILRLGSMDSEAVWPILIKAKQAGKAVSALKKARFFDAR